MSIVRLRTSTSASRSAFLNQAFRQFQATCASPTQMHLPVSTWTFTPSLPPKAGNSWSFTFSGNAIRPSCAKRRRMRHRSTAKSADSPSVALTAVPPVTTARFTTCFHCPKLQILPGRGWRTFRFCAPTAIALFIFATHHTRLLRSGSCSPHDHTRCTPSVGPRRSLESSRVSFSMGSDRKPALAINGEQPRTRRLAIGGDMPHPHRLTLAWGAEVAGPQRLVLASGAEVPSLQPLALAAETLIRPERLGQACSRGRRHSAREHALAWLSPRPRHQNGNVITQILLCPTEHCSRWSPNLARIRVQDSAPTTECCIRWMGAVFNDAARVSRLGA